MNSSVVLSDLDTFASVAKLVPSPVGPILQAAIVLAKVVVSLSDTDPVVQIDELTSLLQQGILANWKEKLNG